jgi:hypothetical protein
LVKIALTKFNEHMKRKNDISYIQEEFSEKSNSQNHSTRIQIYFYLFLLFGSFGRASFFILDVLNSFYKNRGIVIIPKSITKGFEFLPTYFFGILFVLI